MKYKFKVYAYPYVEGTEEYHFEITTEADEKEDARELIAALLSESWETAIERDLTNREEEAASLINRAIEIMTPEQVGQWEGVRAWIEK